MHPLPLTQQWKIPMHISRDLRGRRGGLLGRYATTVATAFAPAIWAAAGNDDVFLG